MNPSKLFVQLIILGVVVVALIFTFTFINTSQTTFVPGEEDGPNPDRDVVHQLEFPEKAARGMTHEWKTPGQLDFWFENKNATAVKVGMKAKSCTCTGTAIGILPRERATQRRLRGFICGHAVLSGLLLPDIPVLSVGFREMHMPSTEPGIDWQNLERDDSKTATVPPFTCGWARLRWSGDSKEPGPQLFTATFWMESEDSGATVILGVPIYLAEPLMTPHKNVNIGILTPERNKAQTEILCWSATRSDFTLKPSAEADPFISFGTPVRVGDEEIHEVVKKYESAKKPIGLARLAYRVPVTIHESLPDGRQMELGPFTRKVVVSSVPEMQPVEIEIAGMVRGEVTIGVSPYKDQIPLGTFRLGDEREVDVPITTDQVNLDLRIDSEPEFLKATLVQEKSDAAGKSWNLHVKVGANLSDGQITPESALYLKTQTQRRIRIPITGNAYR